MPQLLTEDGQSLETESGEPFLLDTTELLTEDGQSLETEDGQPLIKDSGSGDGAEPGNGESGTGESGDGGSTGIIQTRGTATLSLETANHPIFTRSVNPNAATLLMQAQRRTQGLPPSGIGSRMVIVQDPHDKETIIDQYLQVWFNGNPAHIALSLQLDEEPPTPIAGEWENPGTLEGAIVRIPEAALPNTGVTHRITIRAQQVLDDEPVSPVSTFVFYERTPNPRGTQQPEWCSATLLRQTTQEMPALVEIRWRHTGAVRIIAEIPTYVSGFWRGQKTITIGYADHDEDVYYTERFSRAITWTSNTPRMVRIGVAAISRQQFGVPLFANNRLGILAHNPHAIPPPQNPDAVAGTDKTLVNSWWLHHIRTQVRLEFLPPNATWSQSTALNNTINSAISRLILKIKDIVRQGGSVTVDNFGRFEATWNATSTERNQRFTASPGYREGTRRGLILKDDDISPE